MMNSVTNLLYKTINVCVPKHDRSMYVSTPYYTVSSIMDVINCHSSNAYYFVNKYSTKMHEKKVRIYVEYLHEDRKTEYDAFAKDALTNNVEIIFVKHYRGYPNKVQSMIHRLKNLITKYKTHLWITETGDQGANGKLKSQKVVCLNYFISCKNDLVAGSNERWDTIDVLMTSSLLHSQIISSSVGVRLENCVPNGMARNDSLETENMKQRIIADIEKELGYRPRFIFAYAPTYRDYEDQNSPNRDLLGYSAEDLSTFLTKNKIAFVHKLHRAQESRIVSFPKGTVKFNYCYDYSFYDLLSIADCLITDYSSIGFDFMLRDKPLIYNLYDWDIYEKDRGMSFEPYEEFCPGEIVENYEQLVYAMARIVKGEDPYKEKRDRIKKMIYKNADFESTNRIIDYIEGML